MLWEREEKGWRVLVCVMCDDVSVCSLLQRGG